VDLHPCNTYLDNIANLCVSAGVQAVPESPDKNPLRLFIPVKRSYCEVAICRYFLSWRLFLLDRNGDSTIQGSTFRMGKNSVLRLSRS